MTYNPKRYVILVKVDDNPKEHLYMIDCRLQEARLYLRRLNSRTGLKARYLPQDDYVKKDIVQDPDKVFLNGLLSL